ncbi:hypothetical protein [Streptomyces europaeiscabiei]|uniref:hypothetical protein n=1 Tax=Streptomyces europaeiscabiei TaxID=146819 RepID=UPI0038D3DC3A
MVGEVDRAQQAVAAFEEEGAAPDTVADLDGDGFPDFVTTARDKYVETRSDEDYRTAPYVTWGGPGGPTSRRRRTCSPRSAAPRPGPPRCSPVRRPRWRPRTTPRR